MTDAKTMSNVKRKIMEIKYGSNYTFGFVSDPGHGWLKVPRDLVKFLDVVPSTYSYYDKVLDIVYLEEDCDAPKLVKAYQEVFKQPINLAHYEFDNGSCFVRDLPRTL